MDLKLYRLHSTLKQNEESKKNNDLLIEDINSALMKEDMFLNENADDDELSVVFVETGGSEEAFLKIEEHISNPCILITTYTDNSYPACLEIKTYLERKDKYAVIFSITNNLDRIQMIVEIAKIHKARQELEGSRLGVIGKPSDWLIASYVDYHEVKKMFGVDLIDISMEEFQSEIDKKNYGRVRHHQDLKKKAKDQDVLEEALYIYGAIKRLIFRYSLSGVTVRCFDLLGLYKNTACLAFALLNEEGYIATCEGDIPSMLTMLIMNKISGFSSFQVNPSYVYLEKSELLLAHCTAPLDMCNSFELDTHFESGLGVAIKGQFANREVSICKLGADLKTWLSMDATVVDSPSLKGYCRSQIRVKVERESLVDFLTTSVGNHVVVAYGNTLSRLFSFFLATYIKKEKE